MENAFDMVVYRVCADLIEVSKKTLGESGRLIVNTDFNVIPALFRQHSELAIHAAAGRIEPDRKHGSVGLCRDETHL
jgi:hypothetical protein